MSRKRTKPVSYVYTTSEDDNDDELEEPKVKRCLKRQKVKKGRLDGDTAKPGKAAIHSVSLHKIKDPNDIRRSLLSWYSSVHENRGMPWRKQFDPSLDIQGRSQRAYEVWVSEVMLQQTQVATVIPYYNRWMDRFPTIADLAKSDIEAVNALWKGLGYYSRAARLLSGAQKIINEYGGLFPDNAKDMIAHVPGIGRYSAGAISSIAYNHCEPVLDGNVTRLLSRVLALHANPKSKTTLDVLWDGATAMVKQADEPGNINQALIELGSTICKPRDPDCGSCPLNSHCGAYRESKGDVSEVLEIEELCMLCEPVMLEEEDAGVTRYPMKVEKKKAREEVDVVNVVEWLSPLGARHFLLVRRPEKGLLAGLHEFPSCADIKDAESPEALRSIAQAVLTNVLASYSPISSSKTSEAKDKSIHIAKIIPAGDVLHIFSHIRKTYRVQWVLLEGGTDSEEPPALNASYVSMAGTQKPKNKKSKNTAEEKVITGRMAESRRESALRWVPYEDVQHANIGTGVVKVWKKVNELWEDP